MLHITRPFLAAVLLLGLADLTAGCAAPAPDSEGRSTVSSNATKGKVTAPKPSQPTLPTTAPVDGDGVQHFPTGGGAANGGTGIDTTTEARPDTDDPDGSGAGADVGANEAGDGDESGGGDDGFGDNGGGDDGFGDDGGGDDGFGDDGGGDDGFGDDGFGDD